MKIRKIVFLSIVGLLISCSSDSSDTASTNTTPEVIPPVVSLNSPSRKIISEGQTRDYTVRVPSSYDANTESPLVIVLHGFGSKPEYIEGNSKFTALGERENFITVYPAGALNNEGRRFWTNNGRISTPEADYDDIVFLQDLINSLNEEFNIDDKRIYIAGNSNGGFMTYRAAFVLSNTFAAAAIHAGQFPNNLEDNLRPQGVIPIMHIHGLEDNVVFAENVPVGVPFFNAQGSVDYWVENNGANSVAVTLRDDENVNIREWESPSNNADVVYVQSKKGTHEWFTTLNSGKIDSTQEIWNFFKDHTK